MMKKILFVWLLLQSYFPCARTRPFSSGDSWRDSSQMSMPPPLSTGTTIVGLCCKDGIVLGADTRSTGGPMVLDKNKLKVHQLASHMYACAAGTSADCDKITQKTRHELALLRLKRECGGRVGILDSICAAVEMITNIIDDRRRGREVSSALIVGGVDESGPALYQINMGESAEKVSFAALGSGSINAIAVLENILYSRRDTMPNQLANSSLSMTPNKLSKEAYYENIELEDAVEAVRKAVRAGIMNDLGSGSHVDICVITRENASLWRERMVSSWESDMMSRTARPDEGNRSDNMQQLEEQKPAKTVSTNAARLLGNRIYSQKRLFRKVVMSETRSVEYVDVEMDVSTPTAADVAFV